MLGEKGGEAGEGWLLREGVAWNEAVVGETTHPPHKTGAAGTGTSWLVTIGPEG